MNYYQQISIILFIILINVVLQLGNSQIFGDITDSRVQIWTNSRENIKVQFTYLPEKPIIDTFTIMNFSVQNLNTGEHIKNFTAKVVVTNGQRLFKFENVTVPDGDFSVKYLFPDDGTHQVLLRINSKSIFALASFQVFVPHQSPPSLIRDDTNVIIAVAIIAIISIVVVIMLKRK